METQKLLDEIDKLRNELILEQQKKSSLNNEDVQVKEKLYQETKSRANKAEQEVEAQKVFYFWGFEKRDPWTRHTDGRPTQRNQDRVIRESLGKTNSG